MSRLFTLLLSACLAALAPVRLAMAITTAVFKGKLLYFYAYAVAREPTDLDWLRSVTRDWLTLAAASNPP